MSRHNRGLPETRGSYLAGKLERKRAAKLYQQTNHKETVHMQQATMNAGVTGTKPPRRFTRKYLTTEDLKKIEVLIATYGEQAAVDYLSNSPRGKLAQSPTGWARSTLKDIRDGSQPHKSALLGVAKDFIDRFGKFENAKSPHGEAVPVNVIESVPAPLAAIEKTASSAALDLAAITQIVLAVLDARGEGKETRSERPALPAANYSALPKPKVLVPKASEKVCFKELITREVRRRMVTNPELKEGETYSAVQREVHFQYKIRTGFSVKKGDAESVLAHIEADGHMSELYSVAYDMFNEPQRLLQVVSK